MTPTQPDIGFIHPDPEDKYDVRYGFEWLVYFDNVDRPVAAFRDLGLATEWAVEHGSNVWSVKEVAIKT